MENNDHLKKFGLNVYELQYIGMSLSLLKQLNSMITLLKDPVNEKKKIINIKIANVLFEKINNLNEPCLSYFKDLLPTMVDQAITWSNDGISYNNNSFISIPLVMISESGNDPYILMETINIKWKGLAVLSKFWQGMNYRENVKYNFEFVILDP